MPPPMRYSVEVHSRASASISIGSKDSPASMPAHEENDLEHCSSMTEVAENTSEGTPVDDRYSALVKSDMAPPKPHDYETIKLHEMADNTSVANIRPQNEPSDVQKECCPDYVNVNSY